jgi:hypothetical protein
MYQYVDIISQLGFSIPIKVSSILVDEYVHWLKQSPGNPILVINISVDRSVIECSYSSLSFYYEINSCSYRLSVLLLFLVHEKHL